jgi:peptide/nickel transport system substrate-binding protein
MRHIAYLLLAAISRVRLGTARAGKARVGTGALARGPHQARFSHDGVADRPSRAKLGSRLRSSQVWVRQTLLCSAIVYSLITSTISSAETRPHYGGTLRVMLQSAPNVLDLPANVTAADYWDAARTLSLIGDTLVKLDALGRPHPAFALAWQSDASARHWQFTLRREVKFHDGSAASAAAVVQILGALHPDWALRASADSISIEPETPMPSLLAELALPRNLIFKHNTNHVPIGTGPFLVAEWQPGKLLKLAANEESWAGRPFVDAIEIEYGKSLRDQGIAFELDKTDVIEAPPQAGAQRRSPSSSLSLPVELLALVFTTNSKAKDPRLREALALAIDRKPIQSVLLKGAGEPAASILPNWMTGYSAIFPMQANPQHARTLLADSRQPALNLSYVLSYDPRDPQAQLIAERIALNAREVGITVQVSLSGAEDIRLMRAVLPSPDPATSLAEIARELGLPQPAAQAPRGKSVEDFYQAEHGLLEGYAVIPLFHLPLASAASGRVRGWEPGQLGEWSDAVHSLADAWLADSRALDSRPIISPSEAGSR